MKILITCCLLFLISCNTFTAELQDSTRSREKTTTTRERERKGGSESGSSGIYVEEDESFTESCFSSCLLGFLDGLFSSSGSDNVTTETEEPVSAPFSTDSSSQELVIENRIAKPDSGKQNVNNLEPDTEMQYAEEYEEEELIKKDKKPVNHPEFRNYLKAALEGQGLVGKGPYGSFEEYKNAAIGYRLANMVYYKGFVLNLSFAQGFQNGEPLYDYTTTTVENGNTTVIKDIPYSTYVSNTSLLMGVGYMLDLTAEFGVRFGSGAVYQTFKEETESNRETFVNEASLGTTKVTENLKFSGLNPFISIDLYGYLEQNASIMMDINFQYNFINREPDYLKSTPLDWNTLIGQFIVSVGISFNLL